MEEPDTYRRTIWTERGLLALLVGSGIGMAHYFFNYFFLDYYYYYYIYESQLFLCFLILPSYLILAVGVGMMFLGRREFPDGHEKLVARAVAVLALAVGLYFFRLFSFSFFVMPYTRFYLIILISYFGGGVMLFLGKTMLIYHLVGREKRFLLFLFLAFSVGGLLSFLSYWVTYSLPLTDLLHMSCFVTASVFYIAALSIAFKQVKSGALSPDRERDEWSYRISPGSPQYTVLPAHGPSRELARAAARRQYQKTGLTANPPGDGPARERDPGTPAEPLMRYWDEE